MKTHRKLLLSGSLLVCFLTLALPQLCVAAEVTSSKIIHQRLVAPVPNPCPRFTAGSTIQTPPSLTSANGMLNVSFSYQTTTDSHNRTLYCFMTPSGLENPTLYVNPGDVLNVTVTNNTSAGINPMPLNPPNCGDSSMNSTSVNVHYHGTNTSPTCGSDEVIKTIINYGETFQYSVSFPSNEPPGMYWYHPHVHGLAEQAVLGGASGAIIVNGIQNMQPIVSNLPQQILVVRDQPQVQGLGEGPGGCVNGVPFQDVTINNVPVDSNQQAPGDTVTFTPAVLNVAPEQLQFWRLTNSAADTILDLQLQYNGIAQIFLVVGIDGVPVNSQDGTLPGAPLPATHFRLPPASRVEFVVFTPFPGTQTAQLVTTSIATGATGDCDPTRPIFNITTTSGNGKASVDRVGKFTGLSTAGRRFAGLAEAPVAQYRTVFFDENLNVTPNQFFMAVQGQPEQVFNPNAPPAIVAQQGTVEQWTVQNHAMENHEFHFHQVHFLVVSQNNFEINGAPEAPDLTGQYLDMIEVPGWDGNINHPFPSVTVLIDYRGADIGNFVFHCHILNHEDLGMMNIIQVTGSDAKKGSSPQQEKVAAKAPYAAPAKPAAMQMPAMEPASDPPASDRAKTAGGGTRK